MSEVALYFGCTLPCLLYTCIEFKRDATVLSWEIGWQQTLTTVDKQMSTGANPAQILVHFFSSDATYPE